MTTVFIEKINLRDLEEMLANSTAVLAVVGAGDLAVEKLRAARQELSGRVVAIDPKALRDQAQAGLSDRVETLQSGVKSAPDQLKALPEKAQEWPTRAQSLFADVISTAFATYGDLAGRGKTRVDSMRRTIPGEIQVEVDTTPLSRPETKKATRKPASKKSSSASSKSATKSTSTKSSPDSTGSTGSTGSSDSGSTK